MRGRTGELANLVSGEPFFFVGTISKIIELRATYQRAVLEGLGKSCL